MTSKKDKPCAVKLHNQVRLVGYCCCYACVRILILKNLTSESALHIGKPSCDNLSNLPENEADILSSLSENDEGDILSNLPCRE